MPRGSPRVMASRGRRAPSPPARVRSLTRSLARSPAREGTSDADRHVGALAKLVEEATHRLLLRQLVADPLAQVVDGEVAALDRCQHRDDDELRAATRILDPEGAGDVAGLLPLQRRR